MNKKERAALNTELASAFKKATGKDLLDGKYTYKGRETSVISCGRMALNGEPTPVVIHTNGQIPVVTLYEDFITKFRPVAVTPAGATEVTAPAE